MKVANTSDDLSHKGEPSDVEEKTKIADGSLENGYVTQFYFKTLIYLELALSLVVTINLYLIIVATNESFPDISSGSVIPVDTCLYFSMLCVVVAIIIIIMRSLTVLQLEKYQKRIYQKATLMSTKKFLYLLAEIFVLILQPYPFLTGVGFMTQNAYTNYYIYFPANDLMTIFSFCRIYFIFRTALEMTPYMTNRSNRLCKMYGCRADYSFSLKCLFRDNPLTLICIFFASSAIIFAYLIYVAERQLGVQNDDGYKKGVCNNFMNSLWLILITVTTVGYGDYFPQTPLGRIIILFVAIWGTFIVSIIVVVVSNTLNMEKSEVRTAKILNKLHLRDYIKYVSRKFIGYAVLLHFAYTRRGKAEVAELTRKFNRSKNNFSYAKKQISYISEFDNIEEEVASHFLKINNDINILNNNQNILIQYIHDNFNYKEEASTYEDKTDDQGIEINENQYHYEESKDDIQSNDNIDHHKGRYINTWMNNNVIDKSLEKSVEYNDTMKQGDKPSYLDIDDDKIFIMNLRNEIKYGIKK